MMQRIRRGVRTRSRRRPPEQCAACAETSCDANASWALVPLHGDLGAAQWVAARASAAERVVAALQCAWARSPAAGHQLGEAPRAGLLLDGAVRVLVFPTVLA